MKTILSHRLGKLGLFTLVLFLAGCSSTPQRNALPPELTLQASIPGIPEARFWGDEWATFSSERLNSMSEADFQREFSAVYNQPHNYLAISGGGANGAYGAGILLGWSASGTRPQFSMVTGISTGALTAPFAFLGEAYDDQLREVYTQTTTKDVAIKRNPLVAVMGDSMADTTPLKALIAKYIDADVIEAIGREHRRGRRLYVGTVNLDAGRSVIWNIGAIAASDQPGKVDLIHDLLRASSAIPVAFPPVIIPVQAGGDSYDELHVDGGTGSQVFVYPAAIDWRAITKKLKVKGKPQVYVIRNSFLDPDYRGIKRSVLPIASRTIDSLIRSQGVGDLYQIYALCQRDGNDFNLAYIPSDFDDEPSEGFDPVYMRSLLSRGYQDAINGYEWQHAPPGFILPASE